MEQHIRFCTTSDGLRIAYATAGAGPPLVVIAGWLSHLQFEWTDSDVRTFWESLAHERMLVRYDKRGTGLSDWEVEDVSLEARLKDLDAIVDELGLEHFELLGISEGGMLAIIYAARHPERVDRLVLYGAYPRLPFAPSAWIEAFLTMVRAQWGMGSAAFAAFVPSGDPDQVAWFTELQRTATSGENAAKLLEATMPADVTPLLKEITVPTLVAHRRADTIHPFDLAREMASLIPNARLEPLEGNIYWPWWGDTTAVVRAIREFLGTEASAQSQVATRLPSGMTAILFADIVDSTALTESLGDAAFRAKARDLDAALRTVIRDHSGSCIDAKTLGDGVLATFASASEAIAAALACGRAGDEAGLPLHLGLHAGDVIREEGNVFGGAVNIAARVSGLAAPGEVLVSNVVRSLARTSAGVGFEDRGEREMKGVAEPVRVWAVRDEAE